MELALPVVCYRFGVVCPASAGFNHARWRTRRRSLISSRRPASVVGAAAGGADSGKYRRCSPAGAGVGSSAALGVRTGGRGEWKGRGGMALESTSSRRPDREVGVVSANELLCLGFWVWPS